MKPIFTQPINLTRPITDKAPAQPSTKPAPAMKRKFIITYINSNGVPDTFETIATKTEAAIEVFRFNGREEEIISINAWYFL